MSRSYFAALVAVLTASVAVPAPVLADAPAFVDFSAKRVKPPKPGAGPRITVQIAPRAEPAVPVRPSLSAPQPVAARVAKPAAATGKYAWFWDKVSAKRDGAGPGRLEPALLAVKSGGVHAPRLQALQDMAARHGTDLLRSTVGTQVSPALALAVMAVESSGKKDAKSHAGAQGLMQLMPATAERFGVRDSFDPADNIKGGVAFLDFLMDKFEGDPMLVLAGYNAGENAIDGAGGVPNYAETRDYVPKVLAAFEMARGLCRTPPMFLSDGCVFNVSR
ncbi:lytic transglycosylase domain-containing protein [Litorisediminicola beolgyonensis]|uniref:Lytic transglycosylase domain-containing protein n=1 Tax=Litorisediminicola beolgyonensis TaxID=1173614 RepID=A0ABW3ZGV0_9RHOB